MILREYGRYTPQCNNCDDELDTWSDFHDAVQEMKDEDWKFVPPDESSSGDWEHYCPDCRDRVDCY